MGVAVAQDGVQAARLLGDRQPYQTSPYIRIVEQAVSGP